MNRRPPQCKAQSLFYVSWSSRMLDVGVWSCFAQAGKFFGSCKHDTNIHSVRCFLKAVRKIVDVRDYGWSCPAAVCLFDAAPLLHFFEDSSNHWHQLENGAPYGLQSCNLPVEALLYWMWARFCDRALKTWLHYASFDEFWVHGVEGEECFFFPSRPAPHRQTWWGSSTSQRFKNLKDPSTGSS